MCQSGGCFDDPKLGQCLLCGKTKQHMRNIVTGGCACCDMWNYCPHKRHPEFVNLHLVNVNANVGKVEYVLPQSNT